MRILVVDSTLRNETDLRILGEQLRAETRTAFNAAASVFDDARAARLRNDYSLDRFSQADNAFFEQHKLGEYIKNGTSGVHEFVISPNGLNGTMTTISYRK